jgi:hypothetical protein
MLTSNPQRLAWITMLSALVVFCLLCLSAVVFVRWLVFDSPTQLNVTLHVGKGTVGLAEPETDEKAIRSSAPVGSSNRLTTDNTSQGYLAFSDPYSGDIIATVMLRKNSVAKLSSASRPRFSLSENPYVIRLIDTSGRFEVWVSNDLKRDIRLEITGPLGTLHVEEGGNYLIDSTTEYLTVNARLGTATLIEHDGQTQHLATSTEGSISLGETAIQVKPGPVDLLPNWDFDQSKDWPVEWSCTHKFSPDNQDGPPGKWFFKRVDGRGAIHIERMQPQPGPGTTLCNQYLTGPDGALDVSQYDSLRLRVTIEVHFQSLSACGVVGTECPVMLHLVYEDENGVQRNWYHGFYAEYRPNEGRTICDACWEEHEQINKDAWYSYESGNLFTDWPEGQRPRAIEYIEFYADGHQYDVMLNEVALVATLPDQPAEDTAATGP